MGYVGSDFPDYYRIRAVPASPRCTADKLVVRRDVNIATESSAVGREAGLVMVIGASVRDASEDVASGPDRWVQRDER